MFIDIHTHSRLVQSGVIALYNNLMPNEAASAGVFCSAGIHPWSLYENPKPDWNALLPLLSHPRTAAVGECGIDRLHTPLVPEKLQTEVFLAQANLAAALKKPLILHGVRTVDLIVMLRKKFFSNAPVWIFHGFHGSPGEAEMLLRHGILISVGSHFLEGSKRENLRDYVQTGFFLETDDSDLPISECYALASDILNLPVSDLENTILTRFQALFT